MWEQCTMRTTIINAGKSAVRFLGRMLVNGNKQRIRFLHASNMPTRMLLFTHKQPCTSSLQLWANADKFTYCFFFVQNTSARLDRVADGYLFDQEALKEARSTIAPSLSVLRKINELDALAAQDMGSRLQEAFLDVDQHLVRVDDGQLEEDLRWVMNTNRIQGLLMKQWQA